MTYLHDSTRRRPELNTIAGWAIFAVSAVLAALSAAAIARGIAGGLG